MNIYNIEELSEREYRALLYRRNSENNDTLEIVSEIRDQVRLRGDAALAEYSERFDGVRVEQFRVDESMLERAARLIPAAIRSAMEIAAGNIRRFHEAQQIVEEPVETFPGVRCWRERRPIGTVGLYVPAGSAPLPSTVLMLGIPAIIAGCGRALLCTPPTRSGEADGYVLAAAHLLGIREVYVVGGAQAIAAMAYGTETIPRVDKIFGPGNRYVAAAKRLVAADPDGAAIDLVAGPSELLIVADGSASPCVLAADLLSQAEHDPDARVALATPDRELAIATLRAIERQLPALPRRGIIGASLEKSFLLVTRTLAEALAFSNDYAPEHLILNVEAPDVAAREISSAGSVFLGPHAPVTAGDYASGTNHTLPTGGGARVAGGLALESFQKIISFQTITRAGLEALASTLTALSEIEGLEAHRRAVTIRAAGNGAVA
ncbi:MAG: hisD [Chlorobi bacterium]|nr:hisD [Chlorobiota bacterium]